MKHYLKSKNKKKEAYFVTRNYKNNQKSDIKDMFWF